MDALRIGIDLGTTFSCVAALDARHRPVVVPSATGAPTTPSVVWFDGHHAVVGEAAYEREAEQPGFLVAFAKRDAGRPAEIPPELYDRRDKPETAPYHRAGFNWGVVGVQALLLRQLRADALTHFRQTGQLAQGADDDDTHLGAVVTVPAYFGDVEREQTRRAAEVAGLHVLGIINEPTAAALAYRLVEHGSKRVFVFDLGGGTFDVTLIDLRADGRAEVLASEGNPRLGGKDWDDLITRHLADALALATGHVVEDDDRVALGRLATAAKIALSDQNSVTVEVPYDGGAHPVTLHRAPPPGYNPIFDLDDDAFYLETKSTDLLTQIRSICQRALDAAKLTDAGGTQAWAFVDRVILVGGSCRMPMIPALLETMSGHKHAAQRPDGFSLDTAVATGAALYALRPDSVRDVAPGTYGIKLKKRKEDRYVVHPLIHKNAALPVTVEQEFHAGANARLELYLGDSTVVSDCVWRGGLELGNPEGPVRVVLHMGAEGTLSVGCDLPDGTRRTVAIRNGFFDAETADLAERVRAVTLEPGAPDQAETDADDETASDDPGDASASALRTAVERAVGPTAALAARAANAAAERMRSGPPEEVKKRLGDLAERTRARASGLADAVQSLAERDGGPKDAPEDT